MRPKIALLLSILICVFSAFCNQSNPLLSTGWYKQSRKGNKSNVKNVSSIGPINFPESEYLRIKARIPVLSKCAVHDLVVLRDLSFVGCGVIDVMPGAFRNLPNLSNLNLKENGIKHIKKGVFNYLNLTTLYLNKNEISDIDSDAFDDMRFLKKIKLNSNKIVKWNSQWFKNTPLLSFVFARRNGIEELPPNAFKNLVQSGQKANLKLFLSKNNIIKIDSKAFSGIRHLSELHLDRNKLTEIDKRVFEELANIEIINFAKNRLTSLQGELFSNLSESTVGTLDISFNSKLRCISAEIARKVQIINMRNIKVNCTCILSVKKFNKNIIGSRICDSDYL